MSPRHLIVEADGGSRGNPGVAGYGALVRDADGTVLAERAEPLGKASNNVAEYSGLIAGLEAARDIDPAAEVEVRMDSKLVVEQMSGRWKIKHEDMRRLAIQARDVAAEISAAGGSVRYGWIPRAENSAADKLSNDGMDGLTVRSDPWRADGAGAGADELSADAAAGASSAAQPAPVAEQLMLSTDEEPATPPPAAQATTGRGEPVRLLLVRHGVSAFTEQGILDGRGGADPELSPRGRAQADAVAAELASRLAPSASPVRVVSSELARAQQTADAIATALGVQRQVDARWDEQAFGEFDGKPLRELVSAHRELFMRLRTDPDVAAPGGENHHQLQERVVTAVRDTIAEAPSGATVVVATHRKPIMVVLQDALGLTLEAAWALAAAPTSITALEYWPDGRVLVAATNDTHHLPDVGGTGLE
ncbi:bifunctional RNase H/acid phosphatase [Dermacoccaceae bacterium W4C1]